MEAQINEQRTGFEEAEDEELMLFISAGSETEVVSARREFGRRYGGYLLTLSRMWTKNRNHPTHEAEDMFALCLARIFDRADQYDQSKGMVKAWIGTILHNLIEDEYKDSERKCVPIVASTDGPDFQALEKEILSLDDRPDESRPIRVRLGQALNSLSDRNREILLAYFDLKDVGNLKARGEQGVTQELAGRFDLTPVNVRQIVFRSLNKVKQYMLED